MSFDLYFSCWRNGAEHSFPRAEFERLFGPHIVDRSPGFVRIQFEQFDDGGADVYLEDGDECQFIIFNRPGGKAFCDTLVQLAESTGSAMFWGGDPPSLALTDASLTGHLHEDMVDSLGGPVIVSNGAGLLAAVNGRSPEE